MVRVPSLGLSILTKYWLKLHSYPNGSFQNPKYCMNIMIFYSIEGKEQGYYPYISDILDCLPTSPKLVY